MARITPLVVDNVSGGEASAFPASAMPPKYAMLMQNCFVGDNGLPCKVPGYVHLNATAVAEALSNSFEYVKSSGTMQILCAGGGKIYRLNDGELEVIKDELNTSAKVYFSQINDKVILTNGADVPMQYDGTTVTTLGGSPPAKALKSHVHKNRVWMIDLDNRMMATHSALNAEEDYVGAGSGYLDFRFVLAHGDELVDIVTYIDLLVFIFKDHIAIYSGSTPSGTSSDFQLVQLIDGVGAANTGVTVPFGTDIAILTTQGIITLRQAVESGGVSAKKLSEVLDPTIRAALVSAAGISAVHYKKRGWLLFLIGATIYGYSYTWKAWFRIVGADANGMSCSGSGTLYITGNGRVYQYDSGWTFNGVHPAFVWETAWLALAKGTSRESYPKVMDISSNLNVFAQIDVAVEYDFKGVRPENMTSFLLGGVQPGIDEQPAFDEFDPFDTIIPYETIRIPMFGGGRLMKIRFSNTSAAGPIVLSGYTIYRVIGR